MRRTLTFTLALCLLFCLLLPGCSKKNGFGDTTLTEDELTAVNSIAPSTYSANTLTDVTEELLTGRQEKFRAVEKVWTAEDGMYIVITSPVGYNGKIKMAVLIDSTSNTVYGAAIVEQMESELYVRDFYAPWFMDRFAGKSVDEFLVTVQLQAEQDNEIVAITCATVTTNAVVNGVNSATGLYCEAVLGRTDVATPAYYADGTLQSDES
jgi:electron transport complex protein RnfG